MELTPEEKNSVWWKGAWKGFFKGIPQGLMIGLIGFGLLIGLVYGLPLIGLAGVSSTLLSGLGGFLFAPGTVATTAAGAFIAPTLTWSTLGVLNPLPFVALNTMLTMAGNFLTHGNIAVGDRIQKIDHEANVERLRQLEGKSYVMEQVVAQTASPKAVQNILSKGSRNVESFVAAEEARAIDVAKSKLLQ